MRSINTYDNVVQKLCKKNLVIERCSGCLFETLCRLENQKKVRESEEKNDN